jgi:hypothetical protein
MKNIDTTKPNWFTKEVKESWLADLKSGKFIQGYGALRYEKTYCCLGVLCVTLDKEYELISECGMSNGDSIYNLLGREIGDMRVDHLFRANDRDYNNKHHKHDYSNVIPLIEQLPTKD